MRVSFALAVALGLAACSRPGSDHSFQWSDQLPPGAVVHIRDGAGNINVTRSAGQDAVVRGSRRWRRSRANDIEFVVENRGNDYYICAMWKNSGRCDSRQGYRGRNTNTLLAMLSLFHRSSDASADFEAALPANVTVSAETTIGSVRVDGIGGGVTARSVNGTVRATNVGGPVSLSSINGDIRLSVASLAPTDSVHLKTLNGSVHAELPESTEGNFDLMTSNGTVHSDIPLPAEASSQVNRHLVGQIGAATRRVTMRTHNGQVVLTTRGSSSSER